MLLGAGALLGYCLMPLAALLFFRLSGRGPTNLSADLYPTEPVDERIEVGSRAPQHVTTSLVSARASNETRRAAMGLYHDNTLPVACFLGFDRVMYYVSPSDMVLWEAAHRPTILEHLGVICNIGMGLAYLHRSGVCHGRLTLDCVFWGQMGACLGDWASGVLGKHPWREPDDDNEMPMEDTDLWDLGWVVWQMFAPGDRRPCANWEARPRFKKHLQQKPERFFDGMHPLMPADLKDLCREMWSAVRGSRPVAGAFVIRVERMAGFSGKAEAEVRTGLENTP